ncbi:MAG: hypothetical protein K5766_05110 [Alphaproteobacteria bacterium]|nr:hypothetical protein [Alphaproteobacteria bacterium]
MELLKKRNNSITGTHHAPPPLRTPTDFSDRTDNLAPLFACVIFVFITANISKLKKIAEISKINPCRTSQNELIVFAIRSFIKNITCFCV